MTYQSILRKERGAAPRRERQVYWGRLKPVDWQSQVGQERSVERIAQFALERTLTDVQAAKMASPDYLVGTVQELLRHLDAHLASHAQIDDETHLGDLLDR